MRKLFLFFGALLALSFCVTAQSIQHYTVEQSDYSGVKIHFTAGVLSQQTYKYGADIYAILNMDGFADDGIIGQPALPALVKLLEVPLGGAVTCKITAATYDTVDAALLGVGHVVMPRQPSRSKSDRSAFVLQKDAQAYAMDAYLGNEVVRVNKIGVARDRNLAEIYFSPLRYNPMTNKFIVCRSLDVTVQVTAADAAATEQMKQRYHSGAFNMTPSVINSLGSSKDVSTAAPLRYLIVSDTIFEGQLDSFIQWKRRQGLMVDVAYAHGSTMAAGSSQSVKSYIKQQYTNASASRPAPTYVLLVGDVEQIPAANTYTTSGESYISDLEYFTWTDGDDLPDCYYGRFSAQTIAQLTPQIEKTLMYEQYSFPSDTFLTRAALIAGEDGGYSSDNAYKYADPAMDYIAKMYVNGTNGYNSILYYKNNTSDVPANVTVTGSCSGSSAPAALRTFYNGGFGWVNYSAHGDVTEWYKPSFTTTHVNVMTNQYKFGVMIGNCCLTNHFQTATCFGEALLRKDNYEGAAAYIGASTYSYWYEDFVWAVGMRNSSVISNTYDVTYDASNLGMYDRLFHSHSEAFDQWHTTLGSMVTAGNLAVQASSSSLKQYYWQVYHLMGDPSMMPWLGQASEMNLSPVAMLAPGATTYTTTTPAYAYVALTSGDSLVAATFADASGNATLSFAALQANTPVELAVTAQNYQPYFCTMSVMSPDGPYVVIDSLVCSSGLVANDTASFDLYLSNIGEGTADSLTVSMTMDGNKLLLLGAGNKSLGTDLAAGSTLMRTGIARAYVWPSTIDGASAAVALTVSWHNGDSVSSSTCRIRPTVQAPALSAALAGSNQISAGGTLPLTISNRNAGSIALGNATATLTSPTSSVTIASPAVSLASLAAGANAATQYSLTIADNLPANCAVPLDYTISDGVFSYHTTFEVQMGSNTENFETGDFSNISWTQDATYPWGIDSTTTHGGRYSARSYKYSSDGGSNATSALTIQWTAMTNDSITFWRKVSSESSYDLFRFYIDGTVKEAATASGNGSWERLAFPVTAGAHTFVFSYEKDYSYNEGSDCVWIDDLSLPMSSTYRFLFDTICAGDNYTLADTTLNTSGLSAGRHDVSFAKANLTYYVDLTVNALPDMAISVSPNAEEYTAGSSIWLTASGAERYVWSTGEKVPVLSVMPQRNTTYLVYGYNGNCGASSQIRIKVAGDSTVNIAGVEVEHIVVYPNPTANVLNISSNSILRSMQVYNVQGRSVMTKEINAATATADFSRLSAGVYMVRFIMADGSVKIQKIVKK